jgi:hypothetical protein
MSSRGNQLNGKADKKGRKRLTNRGEFLLLISFLFVDNFEIRFSCSSSADRIFAMISSADS